MRLYLSLAILIIITTNSQAQKISIESGMTRSKINWFNTLTNGNSVFNKSFTGFFVKTGYQGSINTYFKLHSQFGFSRLGANGKILQVVSLDPEIIDTVAIKHRINDISLDGCVQFEYRLFDQFIPYIRLGIGLDFLQSSFGEPVNVFAGFEDHEEFNSFLIKVIANAGLEYQIESISIGLSYQFNMPINKLVDVTSETNISNEISIRYFQIGLSIGYFFN